MAGRLEAYRNTLRRLLPLGRAWRRDNGVVIGPVLNAIADELNRVDARASDLLAEFPLTTTELLADWERALGLPDSCVPGVQTEVQRRNNVVTKLTEIPDNSPAGFEAIITRLGYVGTVKEFDPFKAGVSTVGDEVANDEWQFAWLVQIEGEVDVEEFICGDAECGDLLGDYGIHAIECVINRLKPAHTLALYSYSGEWPSEVQEVGGSMYAGGVTMEGEIVRAVEPPGYILAENGDRIIAEDGSPITGEQE